jgi:hypothetical protein
MSLSSNDYTRDSDESANLHNEDGSLAKLGGHIEG